MMQYQLNHLYENLSSNGFDIGGFGMTYEHLKK